MIVIAEMPCMGVVNRSIDKGGGGGMQVWLLTYSAFSVDVAVAAVAEPPS